MNRILGLMLLLAISGPSGAQNLVENGHFDVDLQAWEQPFGGVNWSSTDEFGAPASGSASFTDRGEFGTRFEQCISPERAGPVEVSASYLVPSDVTLVLDNAIGFFVVWYDSLDCMGAVLGSQQATDPITTQGQWTRYREVAVPPAGADSLRIQLLVLGTGSSDFSALIDNVFIGDRLFKDGFESP